MLAECGLTSTIPSTLAQLSQLQVLHLGVNAPASGLLRFVYNPPLKNTLTGTLPDLSASARWGSCRIGPGVWAGAEDSAHALLCFFCLSCSTLTVINLSGNPLSGTLSAGYMGPSLVELSLSYCQDISGRCRRWSVVALAGATLCGPAYDEACKWLNACVRSFWCGVNRHATVSAGITAVAPPTVSGWYVIGCCSRQR